MADYLKENWHAALIIATLDPRYNVCGWSHIAYFSTYSFFAFFSYKHVD